MDYDGIIRICTNSPGIFPWGSSPCTNRPTRPPRRNHLSRDKAKSQQQQQPPPPHPCCCYCCCQRLSSGRGIAVGRQPSETSEKGEENFNTYTIASLYKLLEGESHRKLSVHYINGEQAIKMFVIRMKWNL